MASGADDFDVVVDVWVREYWLDDIIGRTIGLPLIVVHFQLKIKA